jgi:pyruvate dehydrogenase E1 component alpha subunit
VLAPLKGSLSARLHVEIATGEIPGFTHLYAGQEAVAVGVCEHLDDAA